MPVLIHLVLTAEPRTKATGKPLWQVHGLNHESHSECAHRFRPNFLEQTPEIELGYLEFDIFVEFLAGILPNET